MNWLLNFINRIINIFKKKDNTKMLNEPKEINNNNNTKNDFKVLLWKKAHPDACDGNGYLIIKETNLEDML